MALNGTTHRTAFAGQTCGIYPRVSTARQAKGNRTSLKDQEYACRDYADILSLLVDEECVETDAYTSTQMSRPGLNLLLQRMRDRRVPHLIIDTADRLTRQGQLAASMFLNQFIEVGITLHVVSMDLVVNDSKGVHDFLEAAYRAEEDNRQRTRKSRRAKRSLARKGMFIRGNRAAYGFRWVASEHDDDGNVTAKRLIPDERPFVERGFPTVFAGTPYAARQKIVRLYAEEGWSFKRISDLLNEDHVPTATALINRVGAKNRWHPRTINYLVNDPINRGVLVNHLADPDDPTKPAETFVSEATHDALIDDRLAQVITTRRTRNREGYYRRVGTITERALLGGKLARCGLCGATMRVSGSEHYGRLYMYYSCIGHHNVRTACPGLTLRCKHVDYWAWRAVFGALVRLKESGSNDNYLDVLAKLALEREAAEPQGNSLADVRRARDEMQRQVDMLKSDLRNLKTPEGRMSILEDIDKVAPQITKANEQITELERKEAQRIEQAEVLRDFFAQYDRYVSLFSYLSPEYEEDVPVIKAFLRAIGAVFTLHPDVLTNEKAQSGDFDIPVEITLTPLSAMPWLTPEEMERHIAQRRARTRAEWEREPELDILAGKSVQLPERVRARLGGGFGTLGSLPRQWRGRSRSRRAERR